MISGKSIGSTYLDKEIKNLISAGDKHIVAISSSLFIILFLNLFSPFGIRNSEGSIMFMLLISFYGVMAGAILYFFEFFLKGLTPELRRKKIKIYVAIIWYAVITFIIAVANYCYYSFLKTELDGSTFQFPPKTLLFFLATTFMTAPVIGLGLCLYFKSKYKRKEIVHIKNIIAAKKGAGSIQFWSENKKESFTVDVEALLFLEKKDNYVAIHFLKDSTLQNRLLRTSLKEIEENYIRQPLVRCHLSYIVNLAHVEDYRGNSKGLKLSLGSCDQIIPVSSKYCQTVISELSIVSKSALLSA